MSLNVNFKNCFSVILPKENDICKSLEVINKADYSETVEFERFPSKSTIESIPSVFNYCIPVKPSVNYKSKRDLLEKRYQQLLKGSALPIETIGSDIESLELSKIQADETVVESRFSKRAYVFKKLKDAIIDSFLRRKVKDKSRATILPTNNLFENVDMNTSTWSPIGESPKNGISEELYRATTNFSERSYYKSVFNGSSEYQLAVPKTSQTTDKKGLIESVIHPEADIVLIRKDTTPDGLQSLPADTPHKSSTDLNAGNNSLLADVSSSSLNLSSTDNESSTRDSIDHTRAEIRNDESMVEFSGIYNSSNNDEISETELNNATTTVPTRATTRAATIIVPHSACPLISDMVYSETSMTSLSAPRGTSSLAILIEAESDIVETAEILSVAASLSSSSSGSYCSILQSPLHMLKSSVDEARIDSDN